MAEYSYAQLSQMQQEAEQRVREMRKKAKNAVEDAARQFPADEPSVPSAVAQAACLQAQKSQAQKSQAQTGCCCKKRSNPSDLIAKLFDGKGIRADDADKALILSVCFLLYAEQADEELILALLYLLI